VKTRDLRGYIRYLGASICHRTPVPDCACAPVQPGHTSIFSEQKEGWFHVHVVRFTGVCRISDVYEYFFLAQKEDAYAQCPYIQTLPYASSFFVTFTFLLKM
jgi:hypothetical protein